MRYFTAFKIKEATTTSIRMTTLPAILRLSSVAISNRQYRDSNNVNEKRRNKYAESGSVKKRSSTHVSRNLSSIDQMPAPLVYIYSLTLMTYRRLKHNRSHVRKRNSSSVRINTRQLEEVGRLAGRYLDN